jgi:hypothetical protein
VCVATRRESCSRHLVLSPCSPGQSGDHAHVIYSKYNRNRRLVAAPKTLSLQCSVFPFCSCPLHHRRRNLVVLFVIVKANSELRVNKRLLAWYGRREAVDDVLETEEAEDERWLVLSTHWPLLLLGRCAPRHYTVMS